MDEQSNSVFHDWFIEFLESHQFPIERKGRYRKSKKRYQAIRKHPSGRQVEIQFCLKPMRMHPYTGIKVWATLRSEVSGFLCQPVQIDLVKDRAVSELIQLTESTIKEAWSACNKPQICRHCGAIKVFAQNTFKMYCSKMCWLKDKEPVHLQGELKLKESATKVL